MYMQGRKEMIQKGFDSQKYIQLQSERIRERITNFGGKLYLESSSMIIMLPAYFPDSCRILRFAC